MSILVAFMSLSTAILINGIYRSGWIFLLGILFFSCGKEKRPPDILSHEEMAMVIMDVYLAEARLNGMLMKHDSAKQIFKPFEDRLLSQKGIADSVLKKSYMYYLDHSVELEQIYDVVIDSLILREQRTKPGVPGQ
jgi:hypothetical protein